jgi:O-methyltransferase involved in polyketide biosynthesis
VIPAELTGVAETLLWTLCYRALEARGADRVLDDPLASELVDAIDYPFAERFGDSAVFDTLSRDRWEEHRGSRCSRLLAGG